VKATRLRSSTHDLRRSASANSSAGTGSRWDQARPREHFQDREHVVRGQVESQIEVDRHPGVPTEDNRDAAHDDDIDPCPLQCGEEIQDPSHPRSLARPGHPNLGTLDSQVRGKYTAHKCHKRAQVQRVRASSTAATASPVP